MTDRLPKSSWLASKATAIVIFILLLPFAVFGLRWIFDFVSKRM
jgi:hypothetical protein